MKMKRIASAVLALLMVLTTLVIVPVAAETAPVVDAGYKAPEKVLTVESLTEEGKTVLTWKDYYNTYLSKKVTPPADTYVAISTPQEFMQLDVISGSASYVKATNGVTLFLTNDLDFAGITNYSPIGISYGQINSTVVEGTTTELSVGWNQLNMVFNGTFDGNGYAIKNLVCVQTSFKMGVGGKSYIDGVKQGETKGDEIYMGLFSGLGNNAVVKNLILDESCSFTQKGTAVTWTLVTNGATGASGKMVDYMGAGAIVGRPGNGTRIENVWNKASVTGIAHASGIAGRDGTPIIVNCTNSGTITGANATGGIIGWAGTPTLTGCLNDGEIYGNITGGMIGVAQNSKATLTDCVNNGILYGNQQSSNGMIANARGTEIVILNNCANYARFNLDYFRNCYKTPVETCVPGLVTYRDGATKIAEAQFNNCYSVLDNGSIEAYTGYSEWRVYNKSLPNMDTVVDIKDYDANTGASAFKVTDVEGMLKLSELGSTYNFSGKTIYLVNDLDMSSVANFQPIGQYWGTDSFADKAYTAAGLAKPKNLAFAGTFDGLGHTISGLNINYSSSERSDAGLFGNLSGTVKNLILDASCSIILSGGNDGHISAGAFAGRGGTITNCANYASVYAAHNVSGLNGRGATCNFSSNYGYIKATTAAFAFCGFGAASSKQCANYGVINGNQASAVYYTGAATITDAYIAGVINGYSKASGVALVRGNQVNINGCEVAATILSRVNTTVDKFYVVDSGTPKVSIDEYSSQKTFTKPVGYSEDLIVDVDLTNVPDITTIYEIVDGTFQLKEGKVATKAMTISNAEGMRLFSAYVNVYDAENASGRGFGTSFYLTNDIDMSGYKFTFSDLTLSAEKSFAPIGWQIAKNDNAFEDAVAFKGYFNGMGHSIKNLTLQGGNKDSGANHLGLFGKITEGTVTNLVIDGSCKLCAGTGVHTQIGGIAANLNNAVVANVWNQAEVDGDNGDVTRHSGGIAAMAHNTGISNATNSGYAHGLKTAGGIVGNATGRVMIVDSRNVANVFSTHTNTAFESFAGGIVGNTAANSLLVNCENYGAVKTGTIALPGGLFGNVGSNVQYANCYNFGTLTTSVEGGVTADNQISGKGTATANTTIVGVNTTKDTAYETNMLKVWFQTNDKGDVRLVTTIDSLVYDKIVLTITNSEGKTATVDLTGVYTSILAGTVNTEVVDPASYGVDTSLYFATLTLTGAADQTFTVQASAYIGETEVLQGEARTITVA